MNLMLVEILTCAVYLSSILYIASGITLTVCGYFLRKEEKDYINIFKDSFLSVGNWAIQIGAIVLFIAPYLGILAAYKRSRFFLLLYAVFMFVVYIVQVSLGLFSAIKINPEKKFMNEVTVKFEPFRRNDTEFLKVLDKIQENYDCCGLDGPKDYTSTVPESCCGRTNPCRDVHQTGCIEKYAMSFEKKIRIVGYVALVFSVPEPFCAWIAMALRRSLNQDEPEVPAPAGASV